VIDISAFAWAAFGFLTNSLKLSLISILFDPLLPTLILNNRHHFDAANLK